MDKVLPSKIPLDNFLKSCKIFYADPNLDNNFNDFINEKINSIKKSKIRLGQPTKQDILEFIIKESDALIRIIGILRLSKEKFLRIVSLVRKLYISFDGNEWSLKKITQEIKRNNGDNPFANRIVKLLLNGYSNSILNKHIPQIYLERLRLNTLNQYTNDEELIFTLKDTYSGKYANMIGKAVEEKIKSQITGMGYTCESGHSDLIDTTVDILIPNKKDPKILIMSSFQETTSSSQTTKRKDMVKCYQEICNNNNINNKSRLFINFVDGGGWLARKSDLEKIYNNCDYCLNFAHIKQLNSIIKIWL